MKLVAQSSVMGNEWILENGCVLIAGKLKSQRRLRNPQTKQTPVLMKVHQKRIRVE